jgi:antitoxin MazE
MRASIVRIGNSRGIRIPKSLLEQCRLGSSVELEVQDGQLVVRPADRPRAGWDDAFRAMAEQGDDALLDQESLPGTEWDAKEWEW